MHFTKTGRLTTRPFVFSYQYTNIQSWMRWYSAIMNKFRYSHIYTQYEKTLCPKNHKFNMNYENIKRSWGTTAKCPQIYYICGWILKMSLDINCSVLYREYCCGIDRMIFCRQILYYNYNVLYNAYGCSGIVWQRNYNTIWNKIRKIWEKEMREQ